MYRHYIYLVLCIISINKVRCGDFPLEVTNAGHDCGHYEEEFIPTCNENCNKNVLEVDVDENTDEEYLY